MARKIVWQSRLIQLPCNSNLLFLFTYIIECEKNENAFEAVGEQVIQYWLKTRKQWDSLIDAT